MLIVENITSYKTSYRYSYRRTREWCCLNVSDIDLKNTGSTTSILFYLPCLIVDLMDKPWDPSYQRHSRVFVWISFLIFFVFLGDGSFASLLEKIGGKMSENIFELVLKKFDLHVSSKFIICYFKNKVYLICIWDGFSWIVITFLFTNFGNTDWLSLKMY